MDGIETKAFRSSLVGFSKEDVNSYIVAMSSRHKKEIEKLNAELSEARRENEVLSSKLSETQKNTAAISIENNELVKKQELELESTKAELSSLKEKIDSLSRIESEYADRKAQLADIEITAHARASDIIAKAESDAASRLDALEKELEEKERLFKEKMAKMLRETSDIFQTLSRMYDALKSDVDTVDARISHITDSVRSETMSLVSACASAQDKISDIRAAIADAEYSE